MTRRCSHCSNNGHNSRTCPNRGVKLFGVRLTDGSSSIRKSVSMGNLSHYTGSNHKNALDDNLDHAADGGDGYASEDFVPGSSSSSRERKKGFIFMFFFDGFLLLNLICGNMLLAAYLVSDHVSTHYLF